MKKRIGISLFIAALFSALIIGAVYAGSSADLGTVEGIPPVGEVNWLAWFDNAGNTLPAGMPREVMTEDGTNILNGVDQGYQIINGEPTWLAQIDLLEFGKGDGQPVSMIFGGLGPSSGKLWFYDFLWDGITGLTFHPEVPLSTQVEACPSITDMSFSGSQKNVSFNGVPSSTYLVYRSRNGSGAGNQASNGRYLYLMSVTTNATGTGSFTDISELESWYIVIRADGSNDLVGCHSEEAFPTNVRVNSFTAVYDADETAIVLSWETVDELNVQGFNLYRSTTDNFSSSNKINSTLILAEYLGQTNGYSYTYPDHDVAAGLTYYYWLEVVPISGNAEILGPEFATVPESYNYYLPLFCQ
jgi:hypothetical protein